MNDETIVPGRKSTDPNTPYRPASRSSSGKTVLVMTFLLLFLIVGLVALGWLVWQQQQSMTLMSEQLTEAHKQVSGLSSQLTNTESNITANVQSVDELISTNELEIRKLWDVSNKRNKAWIQTNQANIANNQERLTELNQSLSQVEIDATTTISNMVAQQRDIADKINLLTQQSNQLNDTIKRQVEQNTQAIQAIDISRQQNNQRLVDASRRVNNLEGRVNALERRP